MGKDFTTEAQTRGSLQDPPRLAERITGSPAAMGNPIDEATFLARARDRFGSRYDYTSIVYKSYKTPIKIRCTLHPVRLISITPERHLQTTGGCKYCLRAARNQQLERTLRLEAPGRLCLEQLNLMT